MVKQELYREFLRYEKLLRDKWGKDSFEHRDFYAMIDTLRDSNAPSISFVSALQNLINAAYECYHMKQILLIAEYDQPILSSYEFGYHDAVGTFFSTFYGKALKGNPSLGQALLTGIQRVVKESIFSQLNSPKVYTVLHKQYKAYFGLTEEETKSLPAEYGLELNEQVKLKDDGYKIGNTEMYNPWSILSYADNNFLDNYWVNTSMNQLIREA